jgi:thiamine pyrophosphokinase
MPAKEVSMSEVAHERIESKIVLALIVTGGDPPRADSLDRLELPARDRILVIGADSGVQHAHSLGLTVDIAVGDFDSIDPEVLRSLRGCELRRHPVDKDATDLELALDIALESGADRAIVIGGYGGRFDHLIGNVFLIAATRYEPLRLRAVMGEALVAVVHPGTELELAGEPGANLTVLAVHGPATGVDIEGLAWPLHDATLRPGSTLGLSNQFLTSEARLRVRTGTLLVVYPGAEQ